MQAHSHYLVVQNFHDKLKELEASINLKNALNQLLQLYALTGITQSSGEFLEVG